VKFGEKNFATKHSLNVLEKKLADVTSAPSIIAAHHAPTCHGDPNHEPFSARFM